MPAASTRTGLRRRRAYIEKRWYPVSISTYPHRLPTQADKVGGMKAYLINLDDRPERLEHMRAELGRAGLTFERIAAADGRTPEFRATAERRGTGRFGRRLVAAEFAIFESHRRCWAALVASSGDHAMVFEDDVVIRGSLSALVGPDWIPPDADIVRLETFSTRVHLDRRATAVASTSRRLHRMRSQQLGAACYTISREAAARLLAMSDEIHEPVDDFLFSEAGSGFAALRIYQMVPAPVIQGKRLSSGAGEALAGWVVSSLRDSRDAPAPIRETTAGRLLRRLREELRAVTLRTAYMVVPHG